MTRGGLGHRQEFGAKDIRDRGPDVPSKESRHRPHDQPGEPPLHNIPYASGNTGEEHYSQRLPHSTCVGLYLFVQAGFELTSAYHTIHELCHAVLHNGATARTSTAGTHISSKLCAMSQQSA